MKHSNGITKQKPRSNVTTPKYRGTDAIAEWHKAKAKSSMSEAFRDADYATPIWKCSTEWDDFVRFVKDTAIVLPFLALACYIAFEVLLALDVLVVRV